TGADIEMQFFVRSCAHALPEPLGLTHGAEKWVGVFFRSAGRKLLQTLLPSKDRLDPLPIQQVEQLERWPAGLLLPLLPLSHSGNAGIEHAREHRLTDVQTATQFANLCGTVGLHRSQPERVEALHFALVDKAQAMQVAGRLMRGSQN